MSEGEVVGLFGLVGAGRSSIARALVGAIRPTSGHVEVRGEPHAFASTKEAFAAGIGFLSEDRKAESVFPGLSLAQNIAVRALARRGVDPATVVGLIDARVPPGPTEAPAKGHIPFTPRAKGVLERAFTEALALGHNYIGTEHILLGLHRVEDGIAAQVLADQGVGYDELRSTIVELLVGKGPAPGRASG